MKMTQRIQPGKTGVPELNSVTSIPETAVTTTTLIQTNKQQSKIQLNEGSNTLTNQENPSLHITGKQSERLKTSLQTNQPITA
jgi:hypothetical protein